MRFFLLLVNFTSRMTKCRSPAKLFAFVLMFSLQHRMKFENAAVIGSTSGVKQRTLPKHLVHYEVFTIVCIFGIVSPLIL
jgi:hypothetical protein